MTGAREYSWLPLTFQRAQYQVQKEACRVQCDAETTTVVKLKNQQHKRSARIWSNPVMHRFGGCNLVQFWKQSLAVL